MRNPDLTKWTFNSSLEGMLVFAQSLEELLFHHTLDSFKAPALNLFTNASELRYLSRQLKNGKIKPGAIDHVIDELEYRINNDPVLRDEKLGLFKTYLKRIKNSNKNPEEILSLVESITNELQGFYWEFLKKEIIISLSNPHEKGKIIQLASNFITEAELYGFSRGYIYFVTNKFFFDTKSEPTKITTTDQITTFFEHFIMKEKKWEVVFRGSQEFNSLLNYQDEFKFEICTNCPDIIKTSDKFRYKAYLGDSKKYPLYIVFKEIEEFEPISASKTATHRLELIADLNSFITHEEYLSWNPSVLVSNSEDVTLINPEPNPLKQGTERIKLEDDESSKEIIEILNGVHFNDFSTYSFIKAFDYHRAALEAKMPENKLIDLWACLEGFLPTPPNDTDRIIHYLNSFLPSLILTYSQKLFKYLVDSIKHSTSDIISYVESNGVGDDIFEKVITITLATDLESKRNELYSKLDMNPLLRYRLFFLHQKFHSSSKIYDSLQLHRKKIAWHIQRIYTTRNHIMHSAETLPYINTLVENLHIYLDLLLRSVAKVAAKSNVPMTINSALKILASHEEQYYNQLKKEEINISSTNYKDILFGKINPLNIYNKKLWNP